MNAFSDLFIYTTQILKGKNFKVDNIHYYLETCKSINRVDGQTNQLIPIQAQFIKPLLKTKIVINFAQTNLTSTEKLHIQQQLSAQMSFDWNYIEVHNYDSENHVSPLTTLFYFITAKRWASENSIELELEMDVINTLIDNQYHRSIRPSKWLKLSPKTTILREHKDRWGAVESDYDYYDVHCPLIDFYSENIFPLQYKQKEFPLFNKKNVGGIETGSYYLIFKADSTDENAPVKVYCVRDGELDIGASAFNGSRTLKEDGRSGNSIIIYGSDGRDGHTNVNCKITFQYKTSSSSGYQQASFTITSPNQAILWQKKRISIGTIDANGFHETAYYKYGTFANASFSEAHFTNLWTYRRYNSSTSDSSKTPTWVSGLDSYVAGWPAGLSLMTIADIDRTNPTLLKIIKLPYDFLGLNFTSEGLLNGVPDGWDIAWLSTGDYSAGFALVYLSRDLTRAFKSQLNLQPINEAESEEYKGMFGNLAYEILPVGVNETRKPHFETKLLHSDYYAQKLVYDSFAYTIKLEHLTQPEFSYQRNINWDFNVHMYVSSSFSGKFMFIFDDLKPTQRRFSDDGTPYFIYGGVKDDTENFTGMMFISRNNELPLYNSAYLNYIRMGYNYDVKTKNLNLTSNIIGATLSTGGAIASAIAGGPVGVAGAIGLGITAVSKSWNAVAHTIQAENNIERKLKETEMQGISVIGADDVDLLTEYSYDNKIKYIEYKVSQKMEKCLFDLFYYGGYIANYQGVPNVKTRKWFNYVQADAVFEYEQNFPQDLIEELKKKFAEGITFLHRNSVYDETENTFSNKWDFEQQYENWETSMIYSYTIEDGQGEEDVFVKPISVSGSITATLVSPNSKMILRFRDPQYNLIKQYNVHTVQLTQTQTSPLIRLNKLSFKDADGNELFATNFNDYNNSHTYMTIIRRGIDYTQSSNYQTILDLLTKHIERVED